MAAELKAADDSRRVKHVRRSKAEIRHMLRRRRAAHDAEFAGVLARCVARVLCFGGGVQTTAQLLREPNIYDYAVFADTGAEEPGTYAHIQKYIRPFCKANDVEFVVVKHPKNTLEEHCLSRRKFPIMSRRWCTSEYKISPINRFLRTLGATADRPAVIDLGFSIDEVQRAASEDKVEYAYQNYPLVYDHISRDDCKEIITRHGWPVPVKSACDFCMYHRPSHFAKMLRDNPKRFREIMAMEENAYGFPKYTLIPQTTLRNLMNSRKLRLVTDDAEPQGGCQSAFCNGH